MRKGWREGRSEEELERRDNLVKRRESLMGILNLSVPSVYISWLKNEAYRRDIPVSWLAVEIIKAGIETYLLRGAPDGGSATPFEED